MIYFPTVSHDDKQWKNIRKGNGSGPAILPMAVVVGLLRPPEHKDVCRLIQQVHGYADCKRGNIRQKQKEEFESFNGPILMTTNCIVPPRDSYKGRLYTTGSAGYEGCTHIAADENGKNHSVFRKLL